MNLEEGIITGNHRAIARAISLMENGGEESQQILRNIFPHTGRAAVIGVTGAPGVGKSTLVDKLIEKYKDINSHIGVIAVDPTSPFTGGAVLGDRIRMMRHSTDPRIFIRSMATRGCLGGIAHATGHAISILEAAGMELILVETVGVGQDEVEVVKLADLILLILSPGQGDDIQAFKAGIMEIADIYVLNKADAPETDMTEQQLKAVLEMGANEPSIPPIIKTVATSGKGINALAREIDGKMRTKDPADKEQKKKLSLALRLKELIAERFLRDVLDSIPPSAFETYIDKIFNREIDPFSAAEEIVKMSKEFKNGL